MRLAERRNKLRGESPQELQIELKSAQDELHKLKMQLASKQLSNPHRIREVKKDIARILTLMTEKQIGGKA